MAKLPTIKIKNEHPHIKPFVSVEESIKKEIIRDVQHLFSQFSYNPAEGWQLPVIGYLCYKFNIGEKTLKEVVEEKDLRRAFKNITELMLLQKKKKFPDYVG